MISPKIRLLDADSFQLFNKVFAGNPIILGVPANIAAHTKELLGGVLLALEDMNGGTLQPNWRNDERTATTARKIAQNYVKLGIRYIIGHLSASASVPAADIYGREGCLFIAPGTSHPALVEPGYNTVFRLCGRDDLQADFIVSQLRLAMPYRYICILEQNILYGHIFAEFLEKNLGQCDFPSIRLLIDEQDIQGHIISLFNDNRIPNQENCIILISGIHEFAAEILMCLDELGFGGQIIIGDDGYTPALIEQAGAAAEDVLVTALDVSKIDNVCEQLSLSERYVQLFGEFPGAYFLTSYSATNILQQSLNSLGIERALSQMGPASVAEDIRSRCWSTPLGTLTFTDKGEVEGLRWRFLKIKKGRFIPLGQ